MREHQATVTVGDFQGGAAGLLERVRAWAHPRSAAPEQHVVVPSNEVWTTVETRSRVSIECTSGCGWVTRPGDFSDHIVEAGERVVLGGTGKLAIAGMDPRNEFVVRRLEAGDRDVCFTSRRAPLP